MVDRRRCQRCAALLKPDCSPLRLWCSDRCRKAAQRAQEPAGAPEDGPVTAAVADALGEMVLDALDIARAALALSLARMVDRGSVPAAAQLRGVLAEIGDTGNDELDEFLRSIQTPAPRDGR